MLKMRHPESHVPRFRARVDTRRPGDDSRSGCRGFLGLVPQPLFMKSKVCSEEQTCHKYYIAFAHSVKSIPLQPNFYSSGSGTKTKIVIPSEARNLQSPGTARTSSLTWNPMPMLWDVSAGRDRFFPRREA